MINILNNILEKNKTPLSKKDTDNFNKNRNSKDGIYPISVFVFENPKIAHDLRLKCHLELIKIAKMKRCKFSIAHNLSLSSRVYSVLGFKNNSIESDLEAIKLWRSIKNEPLAINGKISSFANLGHIYLELGLFSKALFYFEKGLDSLKKCKQDLIPFIRINLGLGHTYAKLNQYKRAESFYKKALVESKKTKNLLIIIPCKTAAADMKLNYKDYNGAINKYQNILKDIDKINDVDYKSSVLFHLGLCYLSQKKYSLANKNFKMHIKHIKENKMIEYLPKALFYVGKLYFKQKLFDKALLVFRESYNASKKIDKLYLNFEVLEYLSSIYEKNNQLKESLYFYKRYVKELKKNNREKNKAYKESKKRIVSSLSLELDQIKKEKEYLEHFENKNISENSFISKSIINAVNIDFLNDLCLKIIDKNYDRKKIASSIKAKIKSVDQWNEYLSIFEKINKTFRFEINKKSNDSLTLTEVKICSFIKIGFDNYEIAGLLSIGIRGVQQHRYRITKKMGLNKQKLDNVILAIK